MPLNLSESLPLGFDISLELDQLEVLLLISAELHLSFLNFALDFLPRYLHLLDVLIFALADFLGPLGVPPVQLSQELVFGVLQLLLGAGEFGIYRLYRSVRFLQRLVKHLLLSH